MTDRPGFLRDDGQFAATAIGAWAPATGYTAGDVVSNDTPAHIYRCTVTGTSAGSGGPTGTNRTTAVTDNTASWLYIGDTGSTTTAPPDGIRESGYPVNAFWPSAWANWLHQKVDDFLKHIEESRAPGGGRRPNTATAPSVVDNGGGVGRVIAWSEFRCDLDYTVGGISASRRLKVAAGTLDLATDNTHYVYVANASGAVTSTTTAPTAITAGAPLARVVTAGGNITSIIPINLLPVAVDESGPSGPILVGPSVANNRAHTTDLIGALLHDKIRVDASLPRRNIRLVSDVTVTQAIVAGTHMTSGTTLDLNGYTLTGSHAGNLFECTDNVNDITIGNGKLGLSNVGAGDYFDFTPAAAKTCQRWRWHDITIASGTATDEGNAFIDANDIGILDWVIERVRAQTQQQFIDIESTTTYDSVIRGVTIRDCVWTGDAASDPAINIHLGSGSGTCSDVAIANTKITACDGGIRVYTASGATVSECRVTDSADFGIALGVITGGAVSKCRVVDWANSTTGILIELGADIVVESCQLDGTGITTPTGIYTDSAGGCIIGNTIHGIVSPDESIQTLYFGVADGKTIVGNNLGGGALNLGAGDTSAANAI